MRWSIVCALLPLLAARAASGSPRTEYEQAWRRGSELAEREQWAAARAEFQAAWAIEHRPILLFNIASTYWHERDLANARVYYERYLEVSDDPDLAARAHERVAQIEAMVEAGPVGSAAAAEAVQAAEAARAAEAAQAAAAARAAAAAEPYPAAAIARPPTLPAGTFAIGAGVAVAPHHEPAMAGGVATSYDALAVVAARYAPVARLEVAAELDGAIADPGRSLAMLRAEVALAHGAVTASARVGLAYTFEGAGLYDLRIAAPLRWRITDRLALVSGDDHCLVTLDGGPGRIFLRAPLGVGYQIAPRVYAEVATRLAVAELRAPEVAWLGADFRFVAIAATIVPRGDLDVIAAAHLYDAGGDGTLFVRFRR
jgi:tetratricopeptide (TPR) repeat protein